MKPTMPKKILLFFLVPFFLFPVIIGVLFFVKAEQTPDRNINRGADQKIKVPVKAPAGERIVDNAGLLSAEQKASLMKTADFLSTAYNFDLVIVTEKSIGSKSPMDYADDFFDYNGYGLDKNGNSMGEDRDGCLFLQVTGSRDWYFSTSGRGIGILGFAAFSKLESDTVKFLKADNPYEAYRAFLQSWEEFLILDARGKQYNIFQRWNIVLTGAAWFIALIIAFVIVQIWKKGMNTALPKAQAAAYVVPDSLVFKEKRDRFLYSLVTKTKRETQSSSGSGGTHTSSSGRRHGGGGGKY